MQYFKLGQDHRIPYSVHMTDMRRIRGYWESRTGDLSKLDRAFSSYINSSPVTFYPDILDRQFYMIKGCVKEVFNLFLPEIKYKHCCLLDKPNNRYTVYYIPILDVAELEEGISDEKDIFRIADTREIEVAASLDVVEAILRRNPEGVRITQVN